MSQSEETSAGAALAAKRRPKRKRCKYTKCGKTFTTIGRRDYCDDKCKGAAFRERHASDAKRDSRHIVMGGQGVLCRHCGSTKPLTLPALAQDVCQEAQVFLDAHLNCPAPTE